MKIQRQPRLGLCPLESHRALGKEISLNLKILALFCFWSFPFSWFFKIIFLALLKSCNGCNVKCFGKPGRAGKAQIMFIFFCSFLDYIILFPSTPPWSPYIHMLLNESQRLETLFVLGWSLLAWNFFFSNRNYSSSVAAFTTLIGNLPLSVPNLGSKNNSCLLGATE